MPPRAAASGMSHARQTTVKTASAMARSRQRRIRKSDARKNGTTKIENCGRQPTVSAAKAAKRTGCQVACQARLRSGGSIREVQRRRQQRQRARLRDRQRRMHQQRRREVEKQRGGDSDRQVARHLSEGKREQHERRERADEAERDQRRKVRRDEQPHEMTGAHEQRESGRRRMMRDRIVVMNPLEEEMLVELPRARRFREIQNDQECGEREEKLLHR